MDELPSQSRRNLDHLGQRDNLGSVPDGYTAGSDPLRSHWDSDAPALTDDQPANAGKSAARAVREILETVLLAAVIFFGVRMLVLNFKVDGLSMMPNLQNHELLLVNRNAYEDIDLNHWINKLPFVDREGTWVVYRFDPPHRGDIIVFNPPNGDTKPYIKRVIGTAGETIEIHDGSVYVNGIKLDEPYIRAGITDCGTTNGQPDPCPTVVVPEGSVFVLGDNRKNSSDSRVFGPVPIDNIIGKAIVTYWPLEDVGRVPHYSYPDFTE
jgi:signal peptidase I